MALCTTIDRRQASIEASRSDAPSNGGTALRRLLVPAFTAAALLAGVASPAFADAGTGGAGQVAIGNSKPDVSNDSYSIKQGKFLSIPASGILSNDDDFDGDTLSAVLFGSPHGGVLNAFNSNGGFNYIPYSGFVGDDTFTYLAYDGTDYSDALATVTIHVLPADEPPVANDDAYTVTENTTLYQVSPGLLANDYDPDGETVYTDSVLDNPLHGAITVWNSIGGFAYKPVAGFIGTDQFTYSIHAGKLTGLTGTVTITVLPPKPVANKDSFTVVQDHALDVASPGLLKNDTNPANNPMTVGGMFTYPKHGDVLWYFTDGGFHYLPDAGFTGTDTFSYYASSLGQKSAPVNLTITVGANHAPVAVADTFSMKKNVALTVKAPGLLANDTDADKDALAVSAFVTGPSHGTLSKKRTTGSFVYTPNKNFVGTDHFTYTTTDGPSAQYSGR